MFGLQILLLDKGQNQDNAVVRRKSVSVIRLKEVGTKITNLKMKNWR